MVEAQIKVKAYYVELDSNPFNVLRLLHKNGPITIKSLESGKNYYLYRALIPVINNSYTFFTDKEVAKNNSIYTSYFLADSELSIKRINKIIKEKLNNHGWEYFYISSDTIREFNRTKYLKAINNTYYKIYCAVLSLEDGMRYLVCKNINTYKYNLILYHTYLRIIQLNLSNLIITNNIKNEKNELYKLIKKTKKLKYLLRTIYSSYEVEDELKVCNKIIKNLKEKIKEINNIKWEDVLIC